MNLEAAMCRQAIAEWRDRQILGACAMLNSCAGRAQAAFEAQLSDARLTDALWDPAAFAHARIDELMRPAVQSAMATFLQEAARELAELSPTFDNLAEAFARSDAVVWPQALPPGRPDKPLGSSSDAKATANWSKAPDRLLELGQALGHLSVSRGVVAMGERAKSGLLAAGGAAERLIQDRTGAHQRLRDAATERVVMLWMGEAVDQESVLGQLIAMIDDVAANARTTIL